MDNSDVTSKEGLYLSKIPFPEVTLTLIILAVNIISAYPIFLRVETVPMLDYARFYLGNTIFSILSLLFMMRIYKRTIPVVDKWYQDINIKNQDDHFTRKIGLIKTIFFAKYQFFIVIIIIITRIAIAPIFIRETTILGDVIIDTICIFFMSSFMVTSIGCILYLYFFASQGIILKHQFEIRPAYKTLESTVVFNTLIVGIFLMFYCLMVAIWAYYYQYFNVGLLVDGLIMIVVLSIFILGLAGIRRGIAGTKANMIENIKRDLDIVDSRYHSIKLDEVSFHDLAPVISSMEGLSNKCRDINDTNEWIFDIGSAAKVLIVSVLPAIISLLNKI
ncbi:MAG: hypothetical protein ACP5PV_04240 [Methanothrix sp.]